MNFRVAYPEDPSVADIETDTMDAVYVNSVVTLFYDQEQALKEFVRVLKPGGFLVMETVFADRDRNMDVVSAAREIGNSIQAALTIEQNYAWLKEARFGKLIIQEEYDVAADLGYKFGETVETVPDDEDVQYKAVCLYVYKPL